MPAKNTRRFTVSLPLDTADQLDAVAAAMGITRSAFLSSVLAEMLPPLCKIATTISVAETKPVRRRYAGEVIDSTRSALEDYKRQLEGLEERQDDLFSK